VAYGDDVAGDEAGDDREAEAPPGGDAGEVVADGRVRAAEHEEEQGGRER
jgi:hypothetical protein